MLLSIVVGLGWVGKYFYSVFLELYVVGGTEEVHMITRTIIQIPTRIKRRLQANRLSKLYKTDENLTEQILYQLSFSPIERLARSRKRSKLLHGE
jgi:hypothetical protein